MSVRETLYIDCRSFGRALHACPFSAWKWVLDKASKSRDMCPATAMTSLITRDSMEELVFSSLRVGR